MSGSRILVVEDESGLAEFIRNALGRIGHTVVGAAATVPEAIRLAERHRPDLALMDINLADGGDGTEAGHHLRTRLNIPVVYLTGSVEAKALERAKITEPSGFLVKPFRLDELRAVLEIALYRHRMDRQNRRLERWFATAMHTAGDGLIATDTAGRVTFLNPIAEVLTGWSRADALGKPLPGVFRALDGGTRQPIADPVAAALREGPVIGLANQTLLVSRTGAEQPVEASAAAVREDGEPPTGAVIVFRAAAAGADARVQRELEVTRERLQFLLSATPAVIYTAKPSETHLREFITFISENVRDQLGHQPRDFTGQPRFCLQHVHPEDTDRVIAGLRRVAERGAHAFEFRFRHQDGSWRWLHDDCRLVRGPGGEPVELVGYWIDVTERKKTEERLHFKAHLLNTVEQAVIATDLAGDITYWNRYAEDLYGWPATEVLGRNIREVVPADRSQKRAARVMTQLREGKSWSGELLVRRRDGTRFPVQVTDSPVRDAAGEMIGVIGISEDISERKRTEAALRESELRFRQLAENVSEVFWIGNLDGSRTDYVSPAYARIWGRPWPAGTPHPDAWLEAVHPGDRERVQAVKAGQIASRGFDQVYRILRPDGEIRWIRDRAFPVPDVDGQVYRFVGLAEDITESKRTEASLRTLSARLLETQDAERRRIARELHDSTAQELAMVAMSLGLLEQECGTGDPAVANRLADSIAMIQQCSREISTISHLLHPPLLDELGLDRALRQYVGGFTERSGIPVTLDIAEGLGRLAAETETALFRVVQEALSNVNRHAGSSRAAVRLSRSDSQVELTITDNGRGLPPGLLSSHPARGRLGVGIPGMRERMIQLGGHLEILSSPAGTRLTATLPLPAPPPPPSP